MSSSPPASDPLIVVFDTGKTNIKLSVARADGQIVETLSLANPTLEGPLWHYHDLSTISVWLLESLAQLVKRHDIASLVPVGHGAAGLLVTGDPDRNNGVALPMIDYEQDLPTSIRDAYAAIAGSFHDRGSAMMLQATHQARQLYWQEQIAPEAVAEAHCYLCLPQYWTWYLTGKAVSEYTMLSAQSHLWNAVEQRFADIVGNRDWTRLMPPIAPAWHRLGPLRAPLAKAIDSPREIDILVGGHDSSLNLYRYHAAGLTDVCLVSTGTWFVGMSTETPLENIDEQRGMTLNSDVTGRVVGGALIMGGREYAQVMGNNEGQEEVAADASVCERLISRQTMALPSFGDDDGLFPGSARRGVVIGPLPETSVETKTLAVLYSALLTLECIDALGASDLVVLDGTALSDPLFATLVAALRPDGRTLYNRESYGVAAGAALLTEHETRQKPAAITLESPSTYTGDVDALRVYAERWKHRSRP
ncbi:FGGY family carbohydrate kinase [Granulosicoccus sp. 3-233]|uniref:FGGY family carbohydrate kinase n=1 Tax=Granulosicoccus sp. 3-233 TaxID=3417969 RepID=UPI003D34F1F3